MTITPYTEACGSRNPKPKRGRPTSALSNLGFGVRLQFVSEVDVIGLFQDITQLSIPLPRNLVATSIQLDDDVGTDESWGRGDE